VVTEPFYPYYLTRERLYKAEKLKLAVTAGVGSDHVDLDAAAERKISVIECTGSNSVSVAKHEVMMMLSLVRNYLNAHEIAKSGGWDIVRCVDRAYDIEGMNIGTVGSGRIGYRVLQMLQNFNVKLHYYNKSRLPAEREKAVNAQWHDSTVDMIKECDVVTINVPLHPETDNLFNRDMLYKMKRGAYLVNCARGRIVNRDDLVAAVQEGQIAAYAGDVWYPQPAPPDHPWRKMPNNGMVPHYSGDTLSAQQRIAAMTKDILDRWFNNQPQEKDNIILDAGNLVSPSYTLSTTKCPMEHKQVEAGVRA